MMEVFGDNFEWRKLNMTILAEKDANIISAAKRGEIL